MTRNATARAALECGGVIPYFQPLIAVRTGKPAGFEALARGVSPDDACGTGCIGPLELFAAARDLDERLNLDRLCRERAFAAFAPCHEAHPSLLLFVNVDAALLERRIVGSGHIEQCARSWNIPPHNVVIEVIESAVPDDAALAAFCDRHRALGFLLALDDVGAGYSNLARIAGLRPDILKLDRELVAGCDATFHRREVLRSLVTLAHRIGAVTVAEGVEREEEAATLLDLGVDMMQGFLLGRPAPEPALRGPLAALRRAEFLHAGMTLRRLRAEEQEHERLLQLIRPLQARLEGQSPRRFGRILREAQATVSDMECLYVLDAFGTQLTETVCQTCDAMPQRMMLYRPAPRGTDHSLKEWFQPLRSGVDASVSQPYISAATGSLCITVGVRFGCAGGRSHILCADAPTQWHENGRARDVPDHSQKTPGK